MKLSRNIKELVKRFDVDTNVEMNEIVLTELLEAQAEHLKSQKLLRQKSLSCKPLLARFPRLAWICGLGVVFIVFASWLACSVLVRENRILKQDLRFARQEIAVIRDDLELARRDVALAPTDDTTIVNLYLTEHHDVVARHVSLSPATVQPTQMHVSQDDILYYEIFNDRPEYMRPGIIVRGPSSEYQNISTESLVISNGHTLTLSEAEDVADFELVSPSWLHPGYKLDQIRRIENRDTLHLLYTDGTNTLSLFEQPLDGQRVLEPKDYREYAIYRNQGQAGGTILVWRDDTLSYVLIGNIEISQLMNMAQSISAGK